MGLRLVGAVGAAEPLARLRRAAGGEAPPRDLPQGLRILALTPERIDALTRLAPGASAEGFVHLSEALEAALRAASAGGALAYLELEYFGGAGFQSAALFSEGETRFRATQADRPAPAARGLLSRLLRPAKAEPRRTDPDRPVNRALRGLGVRAAAGADEFTALGLGELRNFGETD